MKLKVWKFLHMRVLRHQIVKYRIHQHKQYRCSCNSKQWKLDYYS